MKLNRFKTNAKERKELANEKKNPNDEQNENEKTDYQEMKRNERQLKRIMYMSYKAFVCSVFSIHMFDLPLGRMQP